MCGFVGRIRASERSRPELTSAVPHLARRGPDGWRSWRSECGRVELLHARLAIVDPDERALQPFVDGDGVLTFNGEIYNYARLRDGIRVREWRTESDTEVLLAGLQCEGVDFLGRARGMFSGAWVDAVRRRVVLFRDPIGKKPLLFLVDTDGSLLFGSSMRALLAIAIDTPVLRIEALRETLQEGFIEPPLGLYRGARHMLPGEVREFDFDASDVGQHSIAAQGALHFAGEPQHQVVANVSMLLREAVSLRLDNMPFPAALLSGGIDSTVVAKLAESLCRERQQRLKAFSLRPLVPHTQDGPYAARAARRLGLALHWVGMPRAQVGRRVLEAMDALDEPLAMPAYFALYELVRAVRPYSKVLLTGDGGDEVFLGYGQRRDWIGNGTELAYQDIDVGPALPVWFSAWARRVCGSTLFGHMFQKADRASAEQGVELRCPLLDYDLVAYARSLPADRLLFDDRMKSLLKAQLDGWPSSFLERPKIGFAYSLRWSWLLSSFAGMREHIDTSLQAALEDRLPMPLRKAASRWRNIDILRNFGVAYALMTLSRAVRAHPESKLAVATT